METNQNNFSEQALNWIRTFSRGSRIGLVVLTVLTGVLLVNANGIKSQPELCSLLGSCKLSSAECQQIELSLGTAGFEDYKITEGIVQVPIKKKSECLALLVESNALPIRLSKAPDNSAGLDIFKSRTQQRMAAREKKKAQIEQMIGRLPFVEQAWFAMDIATSRNGFEPEKHSAVISIQPLGKQSLNVRQIGTVRQIVSGAVAAVAKEEIVVTDLNAGRAYQDLNGKGIKYDENYQTSWQLNSAKRRSDLEEKIAEVLRDYPGISFELEYELIPESQVPPNRVAMLPKTQRNLAEGKMPSSNRFGTNGQVEIKQFADDGTQSNQDNTSIPLPFAFSSDSHMGHQERVAVTVRLSAELLKRPKSSSSSTIGEGGELLSFESRVTKLKSEITEKLRPVLPVSAFNPNSTSPISFKVDELVRVEDNDSILTQIQTYVKSYWSTIAVLLVGAMMLIVVGKSPAKTIEESQINIHSAAVNSPMPPESVNDLGDDKRRDAEEKLSRLIDSDPEAAAQVIKSWIRDAA